MVRLTDYVTSGGCACKIGPHILNRVLKAVTPVTNEHVLADMTGADDAGVYQISDTFALVQTLDFFTPMVNDPGLFGKIAAANALSDVYAMGGTPLTAMNIVGFSGSSRRARYFDGCIKWGWFDCSRGWCSYRRWTQH